MNVYNDFFYFTNSKKYKECFFFPGNMMIKLFCGKTKYFKINSYFFIYLMSLFWSVNKKNVV